MPHSAYRLLFLTGTSQYYRSVPGLAVPREMTFWALLWLDQRLFQP